MKKIVYLDMDGTIADLYGQKDWLEEIETETNNNYIIKITDEEKSYNLLKKLIEQGIKVDKFEIKKPTLNDIFIEKVGDQ